MHELSRSERVTKKPSDLGQEATKPTSFDKSFIIWVPLVTEWGVIDSQFRVPVHMGPSRR
jgi:hypothetical protein